LDTPYRWGNRLLTSRPEGLAPDSEYTLATDAGRLRLFNRALLDTKVCDLQTDGSTRRLRPRDDALIVTVSMDLPPAQERWCQAASVIG